MRSTTGARRNQVSSDSVAQQLGERTSDRGDTWLEESLTLDTSAEEILDGNLFMTDTTGNGQLCSVLWLIGRHGLKSDGPLLAQIATRSQGIRFWRMESPRHGVCRTPRPSSRNLNVSAMNLRGDRGASQWSMNGCSPRTTEPGDNIFGSFHRVTVISGPFTSGNQNASDYETPKEHCRRRDNGYRSLDFRGVSQPTRQARRRHLPFIIRHVEDVGTRSTRAEGPPAHPPARREDLA